MCWTWMVRRWLGSTCAAIPATAPPGSATGAPPWRLIGDFDFDIDPRLNARDAHPVWIGAEDRIPHVRPAQADVVAGRPVFDLWRIRGCKHVLHAGADLILCAHAGAHRFQASLAPALAHGSACRFAMPPGGDVAAVSAVLRALRANNAGPAFRHVSRTDLLHLRGLQALDAFQAGCGHREIGEAIFGAEAIAGRWHADSDLRAQVRHILSRAQALMAGGYLRLAGVRPG